MSIVKNVLNVGLATAASRVLGFVRDVLAASTLGAGPVADAFFVAFRLPNLFRRLFAEGAFNSAFVPLYAKKVGNEGAVEAKTFAEEVLAIMFWSLAIFSAVMMLMMPWLVDVLAPGFTDDPAKFDLTVSYTRICFPYLLCMSVLAVLAGVLNSNGKFGFAAWAPLLLNTILSGALILAGALGFAGTPTAGLYLSWAVFIAGFAQVGLLVFILIHLKLSLRLRRPRMTPGVKRMLLLGVPGIIAGGVTQINLVIGTMIASTMAAAVSWLYYADRIYQFPLGMVGVAIGVVLLPELSRQLKKGDAHILSTQNRAMEFSMLLTLPAAVALIAVPHSLIAGLFERGAFTATDTLVVGNILAAFGFGLPAFVLIKILSPAFFAREDTKTPMMIAFFSTGVNIIVSLLLFPQFGNFLGWIITSTASVLDSIFATSLNAKAATLAASAMAWADALPIPHLGPVGIAIATVIAGWMDALYLLIVLCWRGHFQFDRLLVMRLGAIMAASILMGAALMWGDHYASPYMGSANSLGIKFVALLLLCGAGFLIYAVCVYMLGGVDRAAISDFLKKRKIRKGEAPPAMDA
ncbi:MAG: murein biosynthesis integral membrane protein MurJ [Pseudomonadota bacterium]